MHKNFAVNQDCLRAVTDFVVLFRRQAVRMFPRSERIPAVASRHLALCLVRLVRLPQWNSAVAYPRIFFGGGSTNSVEDRGQRGRGSGGGSPLVRGSAGSCNLVQEISFYIVKFS